MLRSRQPLPGMPDCQPHHMLHGAKQFRRVIQYRRIRFVEEAGGRASPYPVAKRALFVEDALLHQKLAGQKIYVVNCAGRCFEILLRTLCGFQLRSHISNGMHKPIIRGKPLEQLTRRLHRTITQAA